MSAERRKVLEMLSEGKITIDEAERLLRALGEPGPADRHPGSTSGWPQFEGFFSEMKDVFGDMDHDIRSSFSRAGQAVRVSMPRMKRVFEEAVPDVDQIIDEATSSLPDIGSMLEDMGRNVGMAFKSWSAGVDDTAFPHRCEREVNETYPLESGSSLQLENPRGSITVACWDRDEVGVRLHVSAHAPTETAAHSMAEAVFLHSERGTGSLKLRPELRDNQTVDDADGCAQLDFQLMVPRQANIVMENQYGDLKVGNLDGDAKLINRHGPTSAESIAGELSIDQAHGPVSVSNSGADLKLRSLHARVEIDGVGGETTVESSHGPVKLASVKGSLTLNANHGSAQISGVGGSLCASHNHGSLKVKDVVGNLVARNSHGGIIVEKVGGSATIKNSHGSVRLIDIGAEATVDGDRGRIGVESANGRVVVRSSRSPIAITDAGGEVLVDNEKGDIVITSTTPIDASCTVSNRRGNVHIHLPEASSLNVNGYVRRGFVETDLPLQVTANGEGGQTVAGQLGAGSALMQIDIQRGHLSLKSR